MTTGPRLFSLFPPTCVAVPQHWVHITVELLPLTEPDKRLSHTYGSSVHYSVRLRSTIRVQVFADFRLGPLRPDQCLCEVFPGVCLALAFAVEPFKQDMFCAIDIVAAPYRVVRYGVITQMPDTRVLACLSISPFFSTCLAFFAQSVNLRRLWPSFFRLVRRLTLKYPFWVLPQ